MAATVLEARQRLPLLAVLWAAMMLAWLGGLVLGVLWVWPHLRALVVTVDFVSSLVWLATGTSAWLVALNLGYRRFWRR
jgi:ribose/xylose/arabinose/galactoside ABC-type transport system permease subunit